MRIFSEVFNSEDFSDGISFCWLGAHDLRCRNAAFGRSRWGDGDVELAMGLMPSWTEFGTAELGVTFPKLRPYSEPRVNLLLPFATLCRTIGISWWFTSTCQVQGASVTNANSCTNQYTLWWAVLTNREPHDPANCCRGFQCLDFRPW